MEQLTDGLWYERCTASSSRVFVARRSADGAEPVLRWRRGAMNGRRVHVDLVLLGGERTVEVSFHPAATVDLLQGHARRRGSDANGWMWPLLRALLADAERWGSWTPSSPSSPSSPLSVLSVLGGVTHPLLGAAYDGGTPPAGEIPRWASPALGESTVPAAAVRLFGAPSSSRSVARGLAELVARPALAWWQLALASAISTVAGADAVATVLASPAEPPGAALSPPVRPPSSEEVAALRAGVAVLEPARAKRLVLDALATGGEAGGLRLGAALRALVDAKDDLRWPLPVRLVDLERALLRVTAVDPAPARRPAAPTRAPRAGATARELAQPWPAPAWTMARRAPATRGAPIPSAEAAFTHPPRARALEGRLPDDLELVLPRSPQELAAWGRMLGNCLGDFAVAVAEHRSVVLGVKDRGALVAAVELVPSLDDVRQFLGPRNRVPPPQVTGPVLRRLLPRLAVG